MALIYKMDILEALKQKGFSSYRIRKDRIFGESVVQQFRNKEIASLGVLDKLCDLLECDVGDILQHVPDTEENQAGSRSQPDGGRD